MQVTPYLFFDGRCEEAFEFYRSALGAESTVLMRFKDSPEPHPTLPPGMENKIIHMQFRIGETTIMASDGRCESKARFEGMSLTITVSSVAEVQRLFAALSEGGQVQMPLAKTFFSPQFGMVADRFGVSWMLYMA